MRKLINILALCIVVLASSCERRPLVDISNTHYVRIYVNEEILNMTTGFYNENNIKPAYTSPTVIRLILTDPKTGNIKAERYLRNQGTDANGHYYDGYIIADPGEYKLLAYNFDTESTIIGASNNHLEINAYTNEIASHLYTKIPSRAPNRKQEGDTKDDSKGGPLESIVYDPDHLLVADCDNLYIPYSEVLDTLKTQDGTPHFKAESVVKSYYLQIRVKGSQYISSAVSLLEGMVGSTSLASRQPNHNNPVTIYFEMVSDKNNARTQNEEAIIYATFGLFDRIEGSQNLLEVTFDFMTTYGTPFSATFDISADFEKPEAKEHQWLLLDHIITIPEPPPGAGSSGGGFTPSVDKWEDIESDIIL